MSLSTRFVEELRRKMGGFTVAFVLLGFDPPSWVFVGIVVAESGDVSDDSPSAGAGSFTFRFLLRLITWFETVAACNLAIVFQQPLAF